MEARKFKTYKEMTDTHSDDYGKFVKFAFGNDQFCEMMQEWGLCHGKKENKGKPTENDMKQIFSIGYGGYVRKDDAEEYAKMKVLHAKEREEFEKDFDHLVEMVEAEMWNHEYSYTEDLDDVMMALGWTPNECHEDERKKKAILIAHKKVMESGRENEE